MVDTLRAGYPPAGGWSAYLDHEHGHRLRGGGMEDQPAIWVATLRVCRGIAADIEAYTLRRRREELQKQSRTDIRRRQ